MNIRNSFSIENYPVGARSLGLSHASVSFSDAWSVFHNQAGMTAVEGITTGFFYESKFGVDELALVAGSAVFPVDLGTLGFSFFQFGKGSFKENKFGLAFARQLSENWSAGIQLDYFAQTFPENERAKGFATFEGGLLFQPATELVLGAHIFNPAAGGIESPAGKVKIPAVFRVGGHYRFNENLLLTIESEKSTQKPFLFKTGLEFSPVNNLALRVGASGKPFRYTAGMGYAVGKFRADIGFSYHGNLGVTPSVSVQFQW